MVIRRTILDQLYDHDAIKFIDLQPGAPRVLTDFRFMISDCYRGGVSTFRDDEVSLKLDEVVELMDCLLMTPNIPSDGQ